MKPSYQWDENDILALISAGEKESLFLEFKRTNALDPHDEKKKKELSKDVSAFANSVGGTIVYGAIENGHVLVQIDTGHDPNDVTKEWLENVI